MTIAQKLMQHIENEAIRTQSREIKFGTMNDFIREVGLEPSPQNSERFKEQMKKWLNDRLIFDYADATPEGVTIRLKQKQRGGMLSALRWLCRSISAPLLFSRRRSR